MSFIAGISHPLLNETGTGQNERLLPVLDPESIKVDDRKMVDILNFLTKFSRQINYYNQNLNKSDWRRFFAESTPVMVANIHRFDIELLEKDFSELVNLVEKGPEPENIHHLFDFIYLELAYPLQNWYTNFDPLKSSLSLQINDLIVANLQQTLKRFIGLFNAINHWYCLPKRSFSEFESGPWGLEFTDLFARDDSFRNHGGGARQRILVLKGMLEEISQQFLSVIKELSQSAKEHIEEALVPLQTEFREQHTPHLGLLFTFLRLFEYLQNDLNGLSSKHLKFFYENVLGIKPRAVIPDQAHLVLEIQQNLDQYLLKAGTRFQNGKDKNGNDVFYVAEEETVLDQAQVVEVKTLFINRQREAVCSECASADPVPATTDTSTNLNGAGEAESDSPSCITCDFIEGLYHAPQANSADGLGEAFADPEKASWPTLGAKYSKFYGDEPILPTTLPQEHPSARIGYVVASPVLLLNEGTRTVTFRIDGDYESEEDCGLDLLNVDFTKIGEGAWKIYENCITTDVLGLDPRANGFLEDKLEKAGSLCFDSREDLAAFLTLDSFEERDQELLLAAAMPGQPLSYFSLDLWASLSDLSLSDSAGNYFKNFPLHYRVDFANQQELLAFLSVNDEDGDAVFSDLDQSLILEYISTYEHQNAYCLNQEIVDQIEGLSADAKAFLSNKFDQRAKLCFVDESHLAAFLEVEDTNNDPIFSESSKSHILSKVVEGEEKQKFCINEDTVSSLSAKAALYLNNRIRLRGIPCFDSLEELTAFLELKDTSGQPVFTTTDKNALNNVSDPDNPRVITRPAGLCITEQTLDDLMGSARAYLENSLQVRERICFASEAELDTFLNSEDADNQPIFTDEDQAIVRNNTRQFPDRTIFCIDQSVVDNMPTGNPKTLIEQKLQNTNAICFDNEQELEAFFTLEDNGSPVFAPNDPAISSIRSNISTRTVPGAFCIKPQGLFGLSESAANFLQQDFQNNEKICFADIQELEAFLNLKDTSNKGVFDEEGKKRIKRNIESENEDGTGRQCITKATLRQATYLSANARDEISEILQRNTRFCFDSEEELTNFLATVDENGEPLFDHADIAHILEHTAKDIIYETEQPLFKINFSGEKEWIPAENFKNRFIPVIEDGKRVKVNLEIEGTISDDLPAVTFADPEVLLEDFNTRLPLAKIEINEEILVYCKGAACPPLCDLGRCVEQKDVVGISLYHFLKDYKVRDFCIDVKVCGLRNLVVQNDEALQDVNAPIFPFGTRPSIDSNFYVGSKEVFCKNWKKIWLNINWKDLPPDLQQYYIGYGTITSQGLAGVQNDQFKMKLAVLQEIAWKEERENSFLSGVNIGNPYTDFGCGNSLTIKDHRPLFDTTVPLNPLCPPPNPVQQRIELDSQFFSIKKVTKGFTTDPITEYLSNTQDGFLRLTLKCQDFQHREYPFVLARQMLAFGKFPDEFVFDAVYIFENDEGEVEPFVGIDGFEAHVTWDSISFTEFFQQVDRACEMALQGDECSQMIVQAIKNGIGGSLLATLKTNLKTEVENLLTSEFNRVKNNPGTGTIDELIQKFNTDIETFVTQASFTSAIQTELDSFSANVITDVSASATIVEDAATRIVADLTSLLAPNAGDPSESLVTDFQALIVSDINDLLTSDPTAAEIAAASSALVDNVNVNLQGLSGQQMGDMQAAIETILGGGGAAPAIITLITDPLPPGFNITLSSDQETALTSSITALLTTPGGLSQSEQAEDIVFNQLNVLLGGLNKTQFEELVSAITGELTNHAPSATGIDGLAAGIIGLFVNEFTPAGGGSPNLGTLLRTAVEGQLNTFLNEVKTNASVSSASRNSATENIRDLLETQLKAFVNRAQFSTDLGDLLDTLSSSLTTTIDSTTIDNVFDNLNIVGLANITPEVDLCTYGAFDGTNTCTIDNDRFTNITNANGDQSGHFPGGETELRNLLVEFCGKIAAAQTPPDQGVDSANVIALVNFIDTLDALSDENKTPVRLRALLPYLGLGQMSFALNMFLQVKKDQNAKFQEASVAIPNEPYTPEIKEIFLDYTASACRGDRDFKFLHLYPFTGTNLTVGFEETFEGAVATNDYEAMPYLFPHHTDSGTLFLGFDNLRPGSNVQLLFQLAEATGNSELVRKDLQWSYLNKHNKWVQLAMQRQVLIDDTKQLTTSGIVKIAVPKDIARPQMPDEPLNPGEKKITIMPAQYRWIKVSVPENAAAFNETVGIFTQAIKVTYQPLDINDRENMELDPEQIAALAEADSNVKGVLQPFASFGGQLPEQGNTFNKRVSERLRHRGRAIDAFDYEHIILENFPKVFRAKCINHSLGLPSPQYVKDLDIAPGFINIAVLPDLNQLQLGNALEPRIPISMLTEIRDFLKEKHSPFVRTKIMNPRYERVNIEVTVGFLRGKDATYYLGKLKEDITHFLAPWLTGDFEELNFGKNLTRSNLMRFIENRDYIDFVSRLGMVHQDDTCKVKKSSNEGEEAGANQGCQPAIDCPDGFRFCQTRPPDCRIENIFPMTARSILTAGQIKVFNYADKRMTTTSH